MTTVSNADLEKTAHALREAVVAIRQEDAAGCFSGIRATLLPRNLAADPLDSRVESRLVGHPGL